MSEKNDGLGLNLSLRLGESEKNCHQNHVSSSFDQNSEMTRVYQREINMNEPPTSENYCDDEAGMSSPISAISSVSGKRTEREPINNNGDENYGSCSLGISECEDGGDGDGDGDVGRKKLRLSKEQCVVLEETFKEHTTLNPKQKVALAKQLNLKPRQVEVWFQNRRARTKLKQTEVDSEYLRICCEKLTEENRRLQKELLDLRALKLSPQFFMHMNPPTTLIMCPSCEKVVVSSSPSSVATAIDFSAGLLNTHPCNPPIQRPIPINVWASKPKYNPQS